MLPFDATISTVGHWVTGNLRTPTRQFELPNDSVASLGAIILQCHPIPSRNIRMSQ